MSIPPRPPAREVAAPTSRGYQAQAVRAYLSDQPLVAAGARAAALLALLFALIALPIALAAVVDVEMIASARGQIAAAPGGAIAATASVASADCAALRAGQGVRVELDRPLADQPGQTVNVPAVIGSIAPDEPGRCRVTVALHVGDRAAAGATLTIRYVRGRRSALRLALEALR